MRGHLTGPTGKRINLLAIPGEFPCRKIPLNNLQYTGVSADKCMEYAKARAILQTGTPT
jgi:hypothetical protein